MGETESAHYDRLRLAPVYWSNHWRKQKWNWKWKKRAKYIASQTKWKSENPEKQLALTVKVLTVIVVSRMDNKCMFVLVKYDLIDSWKKWKCSLNDSICKKNIFARVQSD